MANKRIRVYELARELGLSNKEALDLCERLRIGVKSHSSSIEDPQADRVRRLADSRGPSPAGRSPSPNRSRRLAAARAAPPAASGSPVGRAGRARPPGDPLHRGRWRPDGRPAGRAGAASAPAGADARAGATDPAGPGRADRGPAGRASRRRGAAPRRGSSERRAGSAGCLPPLVRPAAPRRRRSGGRRRPSRRLPAGAGGPGRSGASGRPLIGAGVGASRRPRPAACPASPFRLRPVRPGTAAARPVAQAVPAVVPEVVEVSRARGGPGGGGGGGRPTHR